MTPQHRLALRLASVVMEMIRLVDSFREIMDRTSPEVRQQFEEGVVDVMESVLIESWPYHEDNGRG